MMQPPGSHAALREAHLVSFQSSQPGWQKLLERAVAGLTVNVQQVPGASEPVLIEGAQYRGVWLESGPIDARAFAVIDPQPYLAAHRVLFDLQREDGQVPCFVRRSGIGWSQVQQVNPLAATALDCATQYADEAFLERAYRCCSRWDDWLVRYRDSRGLDLCEAFCEYDTGHDKSPRWQGLPRVCEEHDARCCPQDPRLPYLAPDLSASLYGGRLALAEMARRLGRGDEAADWLMKAERTRAAIAAHCFDEQTLAFFDQDHQGSFVRIVGDAMLRVLAEGALNEPLAQQIIDRWVLDPQGFWTPFPLSSIAMSDEAFDPSFPKNSWGGPSQALTALRAPVWFERYGRFAELQQLMLSWVEALAAVGNFRQQADPVTGDFLGADGYSPSMAVALDFLGRLQGIRVADGQRLAWGCWQTPEHPSHACVLRCAGGDAELRSVDGVTTLQWRGREIATVKGRARVLTDADGRVLQAIGVTRDAEPVRLEWPDGRVVSHVLKPNEVVKVTDQADRSQDSEVADASA